MTNREIALMNFLQLSQEEAEAIKQEENTLTYGKEEYLVLTDEEADKPTADYIRDSVWAFNKDFIIEHSKALDFDKPSEQILEAIQEQCESGNEAITKLIDDMDEFIEDAISADGRGNFLSGYDGNEHKFYIYRTN